jgi:hypothetical protein
MNAASTTSIRARRRRVSATVGAKYLQLGGAVADTPLMLDSSKCYSQALQWPSLTLWIAYRPFSSHEPRGTDAIRTSTKNCAR